jgi:N-acetylneuraminic acid mutarotase
MKKILIFSAFALGLSLSAQQWNQLNDIPSPRHHPVTWGLDGKGYMVTGTVPPNNVTADFYEYDPMTDTWTQKTAFPGTARSFSIGTTYNGKGYMGFGATSSQFLSDLWEYDPDADSWTQLASCPCQGRRHPAFVAVDDKIYVGLGDGQFANLGDWWEYDMITNTWTQMPNLPGPGRHHPFQFAAGNMAFAGMGHSGNIIFGDWYLFDPQTRQWTVKTPFPGESRVAGTQFDYGGFGYVLSGDGDNHSWMATGEMWKYDYTIDSWTQLPSHPGVSRWAPGSFVIGQEVFFFGGVNRQASTYPASMYSYDLGPSSVGQREFAEKLVSLYPVPSSDKVYIQAETGIKSWKAIDQFGRLMEEGISTELNVSSWAKGLYVLIVEGADQRIYQRKFIVE